MAKKPSKSKAKQSRAKARPRMLKEFQLDIFGGRKLVATRPVPTKAELLASAEFAREAEEYFASEEFRQRKASEAAAKVRHRERIDRRPAEMRARGYRLPADVYAFFVRLCRDWRLFNEPYGHPGEPALAVHAVSNLIEAAYMDGCRQGFIEGFLYGEDKARPGALKNRERLRQQNLEKLERLGIADRNAEIVAEFRRLERDMPGVEDRYAHLADSSKTGRDDWPTSARQIANIVRGASKRRR
jgi:hypothetical protein